MKMSSCYTCVPKIMIISFMLPEIWGVTQIFCHFGPFFVLLAPPPPPPLLQPRKSKFWENEKNVFTHVYHKWWSYDKVFQIAIRGGGKRGGGGNNQKFFYWVVGTWGGVILKIGTFFKAENSFLWILNID